MVITKEYCEAGKRRATEDRRLYTSCMLDSLVKASMTGNRAYMDYANIFEQLKNKAEEDMLRFEILLEFHTPKIR